MSEHLQLEPDGTALAAFVQRLQARLALGAVAYRDRPAAARPLVELVDELQAECLDLAGWGFLLDQRLERMRAALPAFEALAPAPGAIAAPLAPTPALGSDRAAPANVGSDALGGDAGAPAAGAPAELPQPATPPAPVQAPASATESSTSVGGAGTFAAAAAAFAVTGELPARPDVCDLVLRQQLLVVEARLLDDEDDRDLRARQKLLRAAASDDPAVRLPAREQLRRRGGRP